MDRLTQKIDIGNSRQKIPKKIPVGGWGGFFFDTQMNEKDVQTTAKLEIISSGRGWK